MKHHRADRSLSKGSPPLLSIEIVVPEEYMAAQKFRESHVIEMIAKAFKLQDADCTLTYTAAKSEFLECSIKVMIAM